MSTPFQISDRLVDDLAAVSPILSTFFGLPGHNHEWGESLSIDGLEAVADLARRYRSELEVHLDHPDSRERLAARVTIGWIDETRASFEAEDHFRDLRHLASPFHQISLVFNVMPAESADDWEAILSRLETIDRAYDDYRDRLDIGRTREITVARRQVESIIAQARHLSGPDSAFRGLVAKGQRTGATVPRLEEAVKHARESAGRFADWLETTYLPSAAEADGVGEEIYRRAADHLMGTDIDPQEAYQWGWDELHRLIDAMGEVGAMILPGAGWEEIREHLETEPSLLAHSRDDLVAHVKAILDQAVADLAGTHFDVPELIRPLTVQIAPPGGPLAAYYIAPSEDFSRPGGVWYSVGDQTVFPLYQHSSTAYHEGFPGHHLQIATALYRKEQLSRAQRLLVGYTGYVEGWGMYAEVLMGELGYLDNPAHYFGMLAKQMYRAARVVVDIGLHLGLEIPKISRVAPGEEWSFSHAVEFMKVYGLQSPPEAEAEVLRYLGWPGQAICYKLGEREMLSIREETRSRLGNSFDLKQFHATVLDHGALRFDLLRQVAAETL